LNFQEYVESANDEISVIVQAEHADAVENIGQIVAVDGVDAVLLGPYDLAASLGKMGQVDDPAVTAAIEQITLACQAANIPLGIFGVSVNAIRPYIERGYSLLVGGTDTIFLASAGAAMLKDLR